LNTVREELKKLLVEINQELFCLERKYTFSSDLSDLQVRGKPEDVNLDYGVYKTLLRIKKRIEELSNL
jgi:hypothetical protein